MSELYRVCVTVVGEADPRIYLFDDFDEADSFAGSVRAGEYWAPKRLVRVSLQVNCEIHGWTAVGNGCVLCEGEAYDILFGAAPRTRRYAQSAYLDCLAGGR